MALGCAGLLVGSLRAGRAQAPGAGSSPAAPLPAEVAAELPGARLLGSGRLRFFGLQVYDARLWTQGRALGNEWTATPFALELQYARELKAEAIAERSLVEMRRQGEIDAVTAERWLGTMKQIFPDVQAGDRLTAVNVPGTGARFFLNGSLRGESREVEFVRVLFGIWLAPRSSEPALREALMGRRPP